jgi:multisubunit Na+/H+ antiporter MnhC subunit
MIFALTFVFFTTILPIQTIAGFGIIESGWALGFMVMGVSKNEAIASGFSIHIIILIFTLVIGVLGFINIYIKTKKNNSRQ